MNFLIKLEIVFFDKNTKIVCPLCNFNGNSAGQIYIPYEVEEKKKTVSKSAKNQIKCVNGSHDIIFDKNNPPIKFESNGLLRYYYCKECNLSYKYQKLMEMFCANRDLEFAFKDMERKKLFNFCCNCGKYAEKYILAGCCHIICQNCAENTKKIIRNKNAIWCKICWKCTSYNKQHFNNQLFYTMK